MQFNTSLANIAFFWKNNIANVHVLVYVSKFHISVLDETEKKYKILENKYIHTEIARSF